MNPRQRYSLVISLAIIIFGISGGIWVAISGWPPVIIRDRQYYELIRNYHLADRKDATKHLSENGDWEFQLQVPESHTEVWVRVPSKVGVVTIKYNDEADSRPLYRKAEYTTPVEVRVKQNVLYVRWVEPLFGYNHWLLAYDLAARSEVVKRRFDPNDKP
jgi:hypothetical protein